MPTASRAYGGSHKPQVQILGHRATFKASATRMHLFRHPLVTGRLVGRESWCRSVAQQPQPQQQRQPPRHPLQIPKIHLMSSHRGQRLVLVQELPSLVSRSYSCAPCSTAGNKMGQKKHLRGGCRRPEPRRRT